MKYSEKKVEVNACRLRVFTRQGRILASARDACPSVQAGKRRRRVAPDAAVDNRSTHTNPAWPSWDRGELVATQKPFMNNDIWRTSHNATCCSQQHPFFFLITTKVHKNKKINEMRSRHRDTGGLGGGCVCENNSGCFTCADTLTVN